MQNRISLAALVLVALTATALLPAPSQAASPKVTALLKQRYDVLATRFELVKQMHEAGAPISSAQMFDARDELLVAELELADTNERRIEVLKARVANLKQAEEYYQVGKQHATASELDVLEAKAKRLAAEVDLERATDAPSSGKPDLYSGSVRGKVMLNGKPLPDATVKFQPKTGPSSSGKTDQAGQYSLQFKENESGAVVGTHTVSITTAVQIEDPETGEVRTQPETLPPKYNTVSQLTVSVSSGDNVFDFELEGAKK